MSLVCEMKGIIFILIALTAFGQTLSSVEKCFEEHEIVPDILAVAPKKGLNVSSLTYKFRIVSPKAN